MQLMQEEQARQAGLLETKGQEGQVRQVIQRGIK